MNITVVLFFSLYASWKKLSKFLCFMYMELMCAGMKAVTDVSVIVPLGNLPNMIRRAHKINGANIMCYSLLDHWSSLFISLAMHPVCSTQTRYSTSNITVTKIASRFALPTNVYHCLKNSEYWRKDFSGLRFVFALLLLIIPMRKSSIQFRRQR